MSGTRLSVNVNAAAYLRNRREISTIDLRRLASVALDAGAYAITVHPRPDERHIRYKDVFVLKQLIEKDFIDREFNIEGFPAPEFLDLVEKAKPHQVTLVPDAPNQNTSDHGWNISRDIDVLKTSVARLRKLGTRISVFVDPGVTRLEILKEIGVDRVEIFTGPYAQLFDQRKDYSVVLDNIGETAKLAQSIGLGVNAGHDLTISNLPVLMKRVSQILELSIGQALISRAVEVGIRRAVKDYCAITSVE